MLSTISNYTPAAGILGNSTLVPAIFVGLGKENGGGCDEHLLPGSEHVWEGVLVLFFSLFFSPESIVCYSCYFIPQHLIRLPRMSWTSQGTGRALFISSLRND